MFYVVFDFFKYEVYLLIIFVMYFEVFYGQFLNGKDLVLKKIEIYVKFIVFFI